MARFHNTLVHEYGKCDPECMLCEEACVKAKADGKASRIKTVHIPEKGFHGVMKCSQCTEPGCLEFCPTGAISKSDVDGIVRIEDAKCVGCGLCTLGCPYGGIHYDPVAKKSYKCDKCEGDPQCVKICIQDSLRLIQGLSLREKLGEELLSHGIGMCQGCGEELAIRLALRVFGKETIVFVGPGCTPSAFSGTSQGNSTLIPSMNCYMTNVPAIVSGVRRYYKKVGREATLVAFTGDGLTADVGFQGLSGAAERGENIIYICLDNEAYMNTGIQRSATTPRGAWTTTTPVGKSGRGKKQQPKYMPLIMAFHGIPYVATASLSHLEDYFRKLQKAQAVREGLVYLHVLTPCPTGWRSPTESVIEIARMAVETNYFPLWEAEEGKFHLNYSPKRPRPIREFTRLMGRFSHLNEDELQEFQKIVDEKFEIIKKQCSTE